MNTIDCLTLAMLIENRKPVNLIDIRSEQEFRASHIRGARLVPFAQLARRKGFFGYRLTNQQVYVVSDDRGLASLATGILRAAGYVNATVVDGGMKAWIGQDLPVLRERLPVKPRNRLIAIVSLLGMAGIAFAFANVLLVALILICVGALLCKLSLFGRGSAREDLVQWRGINRPELAQAC